MQDAMPEPKPRVRVLPPRRADDHALEPVALHRGVTGRLLAGLLITAPVVPTAAALITVTAYVQAFPAIPSGMAFLAHPIFAASLALVGAWLALAVPCLVLDLTNPERVNPTNYSALAGRVLELKTWCAAQAGMRRTNCPEARDGESACREPIRRAICEQVDDIARHLRTRELGWALATRYLTLWRQLHWTESLLVYVEPDDRLIMRATQARARLADSKMSGALALDTELRQAIAALAAPTKGARPGRRGDRSELGGEPQSRQEARIAISRIQRAIDDFRDDRYAGLLGARNQLLWTSGATAVGLYTLLWLAIAARVEPATIVAATAFYLVGVMVGLFSLLYAQAGSDSVIDDYGLSAARLIVTPQLAGIAAVLGVVIATMFTATQVHETRLVDSFDLWGRPVNILTAAVFAFSPGLVMDRLKQRVEDYKDDLHRSRPSKPRVA